MKNIKYVAYIILCVLLLAASLSGCAKQESLPVLTPPVLTPPPGDTSIVSAPQTQDAPAEPIIEAGGQQTTATPAPAAATAPDAAPDASTPDETPAPATATDYTIQLEDIKLYLNGNKLPMDVLPIMVDDVVLVPMAEICSYFNRTITAEQTDDSLTLIDKNKDNTIVITVNSDNASLNGQDVKMPAVARLYKGVVMVPLECYRSLFDADNKYQAEFTSAYIMESGLC